MGEVDLLIYILITNVSGTTPKFLRHGSTFYITQVISLCVWALCTVTDSEMQAGYSAKS